jgi:histidinol-phosphatase (PHP family)
MRFVSVAQRMNINQLYLLEHSFRFWQFKGLYVSIRADNEHGLRQQGWLDKRCTQDLSNYKLLINEMRQRKLPIEVKFGLEICYFAGYEQRIKELTSDYKWDFLTGSIHWINGWGFDHKEALQAWRNVDVDQVYRQYYEKMILLVESDCFGILAHPDSVKCHGYYPKADLSSYYQILAKALSKRKIYAENSGGLKLNYGCEELGLNQRLLRILLEKGVMLLPASDAHRPEDVGSNIRELQLRAEAAGNA